MVYIEFITGRKKALMCTSSISFIKTPLMQD